MLLMCVNLWAVLAAGAATMVIGFLWYSPLLFARPWMVAMGYDPEDKAKLVKMQRSAAAMYGLTFMTILVTAFILGKIIYNLTIDLADIDRGVYEKLDVRVARVNPQKRSSCRTSCGLIICR